MMSTAANEPPLSRSKSRTVIAGLVCLILALASGLVGFRVGYQRGYVQPIRYDGRVVAKVYEVSDLLFPLGADPSTTPPDFDSLSEMIKASVEPKSWDEVGGRGTISTMPNNLTLVISQTEKMHSRIAKLLQQIRQHRVPNTERPAAPQIEQTKGGEADQTKR